MRRGVLIGKKWPRTRRDNVIWLGKVLIFPIGMKLWEFPMEEPHESVTSTVDNVMCCV